MVSLNNCELDCWGLGIFIRCQCFCHKWEVQMLHAAEMGNTAASTGVDLPFRILRPKYVLKINKKN